jgi:hypothetical protein
MNPGFSKIADYLGWHVRFFSESISERVPPRSSWWEQPRERNHCRASGHDSRSLDLEIEEMSPAPMYGCRARIQKGSDMNVPQEFTTFTSKLRLAAMARILTAQILTAEKAGDHREVDKLFAVKNWRERADSALSERSLQFGKVMPVNSDRNVRLPGDIVIHDFEGARACRMVSTLWRPHRFLWLEKV